MKVYHWLTLFSVTLTIFIIGCDPHDSPLPVAPTSSVTDTVNSDSSQSIIDTITGDTAQSHQDSVLITTTVRLEIINLPIKISYYNYYQGKSSTTTIIENLSIIDTAISSAMIPDDSIKATPANGFRFNDSTYTPSNVGYTTIIDRMSIAFSSEGDVIDTLYYFSTFDRGKFNGGMSERISGRKKECIMVNIPFTREKDNALYAIIKPSELLEKIVRFDYRYSVKTYGWGSKNPLESEQESQFISFEAPTDSTFVRIVIQQN